jgi:hypothetical protein
MSFFNDLFGVTGRNAAREAADATAAWAKHTAGMNERNINTGMTSAQGNLRAAGDLYKPLAQMGQTWAQQGGTLLADSLGVNGADGAGRAQTAFQAGNPYLNQAAENSMDAFARKAGASGMLGSGNTLNALFQNNAGMMGDAYRGWQDRVGQFDQAGRQTGLAALGAGLGGQAQSLNNLASLDQWGVGARNNNNAMMQSAMGNANQFGLAGAQAASQGASNLAGLGMQLGNLAMGGFGGMGSGGGFNLAGLFGGNRGSGFPQLY